MAFTLHEIAVALAAKPVGATDLRVSGAAEPAKAGPDDLALAMTPDYADGLQHGAARCAMLWHDADWQAFGLEAAILVARPRYALSGLTAMMDPGQGWGTGIHNSAVIDKAAELGEGVSVGPLAVICKGARIGAGTVIGPQCFIGADAVIGANGFLREGVKIGARVRVGARFRAQPGAVIGGDGFSYVPRDTSSGEKVRQTPGDPGDKDAQSWARIHSLGAVEIGDDVELGANSTIDRGTIRDTRIGTGTKIDNLVMIGHNCEIGENALLCGCVGIAGSTRIGNNVILAGQTGVGDHLTIGDNVVTGGGTIVLSNIPKGQVMLGYPATRMDNQMSIYKNLRRLKRLFADVKDLKKAVSNRPPNE
ncbi:UDP-3-O-[3-hydroxymyristoyl] glucosamine N-acyltransferase [hydrothermal vent metagenome]|uniref:UDP-3-O-[3-hydroxymyristoyl] glucosamine N-acyltransferase n=1 Tax=hydrothermal vent metagenome TaxID=652676 RepID=A0A3B0RDN8_9ZZZZ